jgi:D-proline reductase (dithiol) PrdB
MAELSDLPLSLRLFVKTYPWRRIDPVPFAPLRKPLTEARVAIVSTAGLVLPSQKPFDDKIKGGDWSWREIPDATDVRTLVDAHRSASYNHAGVRADANLGMPLDRLHDLAASREIGAANQRHFSLMGSITAPGRLVATSAPAIASRLVEDRVDAALLIPI